MGITKPDQIVEAVKHADSIELNPDATMLRKKGL